LHFFAEKINNFGIPTNNKHLYNMNKKKIALIAGLIIAVVAVRLLFNEMKWFNLMPIAALGIFFGSAFQNKRSPFIILIGAMILTDVCFTMFMPQMAPNLNWALLLKYVGVGLVVLMGTKLDPEKWTRALGFTLGGTLVFWMVSNLGVFAAGYYGYSWAGFVECYLMAIPFYQAEGSQLFLNAFTSNLAFSAIAFGVYKLSLLRKLQLARA